METSNALQGTPAQVEEWNPEDELLCMICCGLGILQIVLAVWVYYDAEAKGNNGILWALVILVSNLAIPILAGFGVFILYLLLGRKERAPSYPTQMYWQPMAPMQPPYHPPPFAYTPPPSYDYPEYYSPGYYPASEYKEYEEEKEGEYYMVDEEEE